MTGAQEIKQVCAVRACDHAGHRVGDEVVDLDEGVQMETGWMSVRDSYHETGAEM